MKYVDQTDNLLTLSFHHTVHPFERNGLIAMDTKMDFSIKIYLLIFFNK